MLSQRPLPWLIVMLATTLHGWGISRSPLPAQDGLKFIRVARAFHQQPWPRVIRETDQHPLFPAAIALAQPVIALGFGTGPDSWRIAAQAVSALASLFVLIPLHGLSRALFGRAVADLACLLWVLLPLPATIGHDTLSDPLALLACLSSLESGRRALQGRGWRWAVASGLLAGLGFLTRPEVLVVVLAMTLTGVSLAFRRSTRTMATSRLDWRRRTELVALSVAFLAMVGAYASIKGEISEKLALRRWAALAPSAPPKSPRRLDPSNGLDDPSWDFSAKMEVNPHTSWTPQLAAKKLLACWAEGMGWLFAPFVAWGAVRSSTRVGGLVAKRLCAIYALVYAVVLIRHASNLSYLSARHCLSLVILAMPWAAAGIVTCARRAGRWIPSRTSRGLIWVGLTGLIVAGIGLQTKPAHASRQGHCDAGRWLAENCSQEAAIFDSRGWAAFVSGRERVYDAWHFRQALQDQHLAYLVVGSEEIRADGGRAATLRALLAYAAEPVATFSGRLGEPDEQVEVYRFRKPSSWEGFRP